MGMVRKTMSIGTLGLVSFRSKKEKLQRTERARVEAETALEQEHAAREHAEARIVTSEKRRKRAERKAARSTHQLEGEKGKRRKRRAVQRAEAAELGRRAGRKARKAAKAAQKAAKRARKATKEAVVPRAEKVVEKVAAKAGDAIDQL